MAMIASNNQREATAAMARCQQLDKLVADDINAEANEPPKSRNKDLQKTKLCIYNAQGACGLGGRCPFAHTVSEMRVAPNLAKTQLCTKFMNGSCWNENCTYAHGEAELVAPPNYKKKMCHWHQKGQCRNGAKCGFAHSISDLAPGSPELEAFEAEQAMKASPWHATKPMKQRREDDGDASTVAPSSSRHDAMTDVSIMSGSRGAMPQENLYRMMAGRGAAPLKDQVASMGQAIADLQAKLSEVEGQVSECDVAQMKQTMQQLSNEYGSVEATVRTRQQPSTSRAVGKKPVVPTNDDRSGAGMGKRSTSLMRNAQACAPSVRRPAATKKNWWQEYGARSALAVVTIALMGVVEFTLNKLLVHNFCTTFNASASML